MKKVNSILLGLAFSLGLVACGSNSESNTDSNGTLNADSSSNSQMMDSGTNMAPAEGMGDSTLYQDSNRRGGGSGTGSGGATTGSANDSVKRVGGGSTSQGDTANSKVGRGGSGKGH